ncbi:hypothetical protein [Nocardia arizonensis]|uniref:hypothetical protein n=1 Tax=Nocardia arizonensis TaxID=1141647 RepID=UPI001C3FEF14|nr:hypothetical protein [Nocardia arizonensis]
MGVIDLDAIEDLDEARRKLRRIATRQGLTLVDVMTFRPAQQGWVFRMIEAVHLMSAHAVCVVDIRHVHNLDRAVTGVADLHAGDGLIYRYVGYGRGHTRPSLAHLGGCAMTWVQLGLAAVIGLPVAVIGTAGPAGATGAGPQFQDHRAANVTRWVSRVPLQAGDVTTPEAGTHFSPCRGTDLPSTKELTPAGFPLDRVDPCRDSRVHRHNPRQGRVVVPVLLVTAQHVRTAAVRGGAPRKLVTRLWSWIGVSCGRVGFGRAAVPGCRGGRPG